MADIRVTGSVDDFNRADENPIAAPWTRNWSSGINCRLLSNAMKSTSVNPANSGQSFKSDYGPFTDDNIECWAISTGAAAQADSYRLGLCDDAVGMNGYILRCENPVGADKWAIRRYTNGVATQLISVNGPLPGSGVLVCMQLSPAGVFCYGSSDGGANWTLRVSHADTTYRSNLFLHLGTNGTGPGWTEVGGGVAVPSGNPSYPKIIRRTPRLDEWFP